MSDTLCTILYYTVPYNVACCSLYSSEEQEQPQGKGNAQVEVDKIMELLNQLLPIDGNSNRKHLNKCSVRRQLK